MKHLLVLTDNSKEEQTKHIKEFLYHNILHCFDTFFNPHHLPSAFYARSLQSQTGDTMALQCSEFLELLNFEPSSLPQITRSEKPALASRQCYALGR